MPQSLKALGLFLASTILTGCAGNRQILVAGISGSCSSPAHREIRLVRESSAFASALRNLTGHAPASESDFHRDWRCLEMRREIFGGFHGLSVVRTVATESHWLRLDMYFGVTRDSVVLLNPRVVDESGVRIDTTAWNSFIRSRLDLRLGLTGELAALTCVLDQVSDGWPGPKDCWAPEPINMSWTGESFTISRRSSGHDPSTVYWVRPDGSLAEVPRFHPMLDSHR